VRALGEACEKTGCPRGQTAQNGQALVKLVPAPALPPSAMFGKLAEETRVQGDIVSGLDEHWEADA